jgi:hypothetical protein
MRVKNERREVRERVTHENKSADNADQEPDDGHERTAAEAANTTAAAALGKKCEWKRREGRGGEKTDLCPEILLVSSTVLAKRGAVGEIKTKGSEGR